MIDVNLFITFEKNTAYRQVWAYSLTVLLFTVSGSVIISLIECSYKD